MLLEQVRWVVREGSDAMHPAIGSNVNIHKSVPGLSELVSSDQLKQHVGKRRSAVKWKRVDQPVTVSIPRVSAHMRLSSSPIP